MAQRRRFRGLLGLDPERDVDQELSFHLEMRVRELEARGEAPERARQIARERFGNYDATRQECVAVNQTRRRRLRRADYVGDLLQDGRYAVRTLARSPGFTVAAVLTLAIGLTGTISMVSIVNGVLLSPLPVRSEQELVVGWRGRPEAGARRWPFTTADLDLLRRESRTLAGVAGVGYQDPWPYLLEDAGAPTAVRTSRVTGDFFRVLGAEPLLGRALDPGDDVAGAENVLVLSHGLWQSRYGSAPDVLGRRVTVGGQRFTVVGVMPRDVEHPRRVEAWVTVSGMQTMTTSRSARLAMSTELDLLARAHPGVTAMQADDELRLLGASLDALRPSGDGRGFVPQLQPYREYLIGDVRRGIGVMFAAVALVLMIACANVAGLVLMRGDSRRAEFAVRTSLGASRGRVIRQLVVEGAMLAMAAALVALGGAWVAIPRLLAWVPDGLPRRDTVQVDGMVILATLVVAACAAIVLSVIPALLCIDHRVTRHLAGAGRGSVPGARRGWRRGLVAGQVALATASLVATLLFVSSLQHLHAEASALASDDLVAVPLVMPQARYADREQWRQLVTDLAAALEVDPRVAGATPINVTPFSGTGWDVPVFTAEGQSDDDVKANPALNFEEIHPRYFRTFEVALVRGRPFTDADRKDSLPVAIVSADVAERVWPGQDPIGKRLKWGSPVSKGPWLTVVGVSTPTRYRDLHLGSPTLYVPALQMLGGADQIVVRTSMDLGPLVDLVRARLRTLDPEVQIMPLRPFWELLSTPLARPRFYSLLMTIFGATGVALAMVGLYGVVAASVRQRRREFGVRMALGAEARHVRRLVLHDSAWLVIGGLVLGLSMALGIGQALRGLLYGVEPLDPVSLLGAVGGILMVSAAALAMPLRAAGRVEPAEVLRAE